MLEHCHQSSFEGALRGIFERGEFFCNRCMEILANYVDLDRLVAPELDPEPLYPTKQNQKAIISQCSIRTIFIQPTVAAPLPPKPREVPRKEPEPKPVPVQVVQHPPIESVNIFKDEKFQKLCALLEKGLEAAEIPKQKKISSRDELEDHLLADRIRELSEDLRISQRDLKEHQIAIEKLAGRYQIAKSQLGIASKTITDLQRQISQTDSLKVMSA